MDNQDLSLSFGAKNYCDGVKLKPMSCHQISAMAGHRLFVHGGSTEASCFRYALSCVQPEVEVISLATWPTR